MIDLLWNIGEAVGMIEVEVLMPIKIDPKSDFHSESTEDSLVLVLGISCEFDESIILLQFLSEFQPILLSQVPDHSLEEIFLTQLVSAYHIS
jgi:hypothetical protein